MAFSATDWAYRLSDWSGSAQGNKSWSALGASTQQGQYFTVLSKPNFYDTLIYYSYEGRGAGGTTGARNPDPFTVSTYRIDYFYSSYYSSFGYFQSTTTAYGNVDYYQPQGNYSGGATYVPASGTFYSAGSPSYYAEYNVAAVMGVNSWTPNTFYNYSPWGAPPYSAGDNIFIGAGSSPFSAYPYQYVF